MAIFFIKKIWQNEIDESVHSQFIRFSRGRFENKFVTNISRNGKCKLSSTFEMTNNLVIFVSSLTSKIKASGIVLTKEDPEPIMEQLGIKGTCRKKAAVFEIQMDTELTANQVKGLSDKAYAMLLDCIGDGIQLKMKKKKLPQPPKGPESKVDEKFCVLELDMKYWTKLKEEFAFDIQDFKKAGIRHAVEIKDIILPQGEKNFEKIRLNAKKKGRIIRKITADGKETEVEKDILV
jgi:hypothetical protein